MVSFVMKPASEQPPARKMGIGKVRKRVRIWCSETNCVSIRVSSEQPESTEEMISLRRDRGQTTNREGEGSSANQARTEGVSFI
jgi:hypothetical protein